MMYNILMERSKKLEEENSSLVLENETYQRQYEKSIDDISKQVVQALLTQKVNGHIRGTWSIVIAKSMKSFSLVSAGSPRAVLTAAGTTC